MLVPAPVRAGDTVALVACSGAVDPHRLRAGVAVIESWGVRVRLGDTVRHDDARDAALPFLAASDAERARDFHAAWLDPDVRAVIAARGGYGSQRMLDLLDWAELRRATPTWFAGSSDATAVHQAIATHLELPTVLSAMPATSYFDAVAAEQLRAALFTPDRRRVFHTPCGRALRTGHARGRTVGGNLSVLTASLGAPESRPPTDAIALLEDVDEEPYRLDRMLTQLRRGGWFDDVTGVALGSWSGCGSDEDVTAVLRDRLGPLGVPVVAGLDFGHHAGSWALPLGWPAELDAENATLTLGEG